MLAGPSAHGYASCRNCTLAKRFRKLDARRSAMMAHRPAGFDAIHDRGSVGGTPNIRRPSAVVQIDPGADYRALTASAPGIIKTHRVAFARGNVARNDLDRALIAPRARRDGFRGTPAEWPCAVSITIMRTGFHQGLRKRSLGPASPTVVAASNPQPPKVFILARGGVQHTDSSVSFQVRQTRSGLPCASVTEQLFRFRRAFHSSLTPLSSRSAGSCQQGQIKSSTSSPVTGVASSECKTHVAVGTIPTTATCFVHHRKKKKKGVDLVGTDSVPQTPFGIPRAFGRGARQGDRRY